MIKEIECVIIGRVQMVMFRDFAQRKARLYGIKGVVENMEDGSVKITAQGEEKKLEKFVKQLEQGPMLAQVEEASVTWGDPKKNLPPFDIIF